MAKNKATIKKPPKVVENAEQVTNGLSGVIFGQGFEMGLGGGSQLSQTDTLFYNLRNYLISNMRQPLSSMYVEFGLVETIVDLPVEDALRGGFKIKSKQLDENEAAEIEMDMHSKGDVEEAKSGEKWKRLYGGAGVLVITDQKSDTPINVEAIKEDTPLEFRASDMWELYWDRQNPDEHNTEILTDAEYSDEERLDEDADYFSYYGKRVQHSRVIKLKGKQAPSFLRPRLRGWGLSIVESIIRSINQYLKSTDLSFEVLDEFKLDIFKINGLIQALSSPQGEQMIAKRLALANTQKNYQNALAMDASDDYVQKQLSFAGLSDVMNGIRMQLASDLRIPLTKLFGISASGFNSGEDDIENYNGMIESMVRPSLIKTLTFMAKLRCQQKYGFIPSDLQIVLEPLRVLSSTQVEEVKTQKFNRLIQARQANELTSEEFREQCNKGELFPERLDMDVDLSALQAQGQEEDEGDDKAKEEKGLAPKPKNKTKPKQAKEAEE